MPFFRAHSFRLTTGERWDQDRLRPPALRGRTATPPWRGRFSNRTTLVSWTSPAFGWTDALFPNTKSDLHTNVVRTVKRPRQGGVAVRPSPFA
jgi:hypothetical protein